MAKAAEKLSSMLFLINWIAFFSIITCNKETKVEKSRLLLLLVLHEL